MRDDLAAARAMLAGISHPAIRHAIARALEPLERIEYAARLLGDGLSMPEVRDRLMTRYGIRRSQAYETIGEALDSVR